MAVNELMQKFDRLQRKRDEANNNVIQLQTKISSAQEAIKQITDGWSQVYGFSTYEEATQRLKELEAEITMTMNECEEYLRGVGDVGSDEI